MLPKQNRAPSKQGVFYQLSLSKNNGPFLSKDIMHDNPKSNHLLAHRPALDEHQTMVKTLSDLDNNLRTLNLQDSNTENFSVIFQFCDNELAHCRQISAYLSVQESKFKKEIDNLYERISSKNNQLLQSSMPVLKTLMKKVKESNQNDKAQYYKIQKQLQSIEMQKRTMEHMITSCRNRIEDLQATFGCGVGSDKLKSCSTSTTNIYE